ncbi:MAG: 1-acyl-sn-glycerol-3-phosphate acyltransferase, partial [Acidimicrobiia bacterium]|nr:1-acyl-sn-glycerol-3-phosphate acyltransferase [Acidimicrobiia bacterium]
MRSGALQRRLVTIPRTAALFLGLTILFPGLLVLTGGVDLVRGLVTHKPWIASRLLTIGWVYLAAQMVVVVVSGLQWVTALPSGNSRPAKLAESSYQLQAWWVRFIVAAMERVLGLRFESTDNEVVAPGPVIVLFRHISIVDNLLPYVFVSDRAGIRLRWVLKKELLSDPALDIGGNRMPNYFVDRHSDSSEQETANIAALGADLGPTEGILLFPEGTRFSPDTYEARMLRLSESSPELYKIMEGHDQVLPPRTGGVLALLDSGMDVVFGIHTGLESLRGLKEIWRETPVGRRIQVTFRRVAAADIPVAASDRIRWLHEECARVDDTI